MNLPHPTVSVTTPPSTSTIVIKLGGRALDAPGAERELAESLASLEGRAVLVHGGGQEVSAWCRRLGHEPTFHRGLRITDDTTLDVAAAVLGGLANARHVASLRAAGIDALGVSAGDGGLVTVQRHPDAAQLGHVGIATGVRVALLEQLLALGLTPVISSMGASEGALLNLNADEVAGALAGALKARAFFMLSDVDGVMLDGALKANIATAELPALLARDDVRDGMLPKLQAAARALEAGVARVLICAWRGPQTFTNVMNGTQPATTVRIAREERTHA